MDELVALYDDEGRPCGSAPRPRMRAENLHHAATAVVVRDRLGRVYVHRRTTTKDVYPGRRDFAAGGVLTAGEDPHDAAVRELTEELGVTGVDLSPLGEGDYRDDHTSYRGFCFAAEWDGPMRWQPEEVASGEWMTIEALVAAIEAEPDDFMPDTVGLLGGWLRNRLADRWEPEQGWDCVTVVVEDRWVDRRPRRPEVADQLRREVAVLGRVAERLPLAVPRPAVLEEQPLRVRHPIVPGEPVEPSSLTAADGRAVGEFLTALHTDRGPWPAVLPTAAQEHARLLGDLAELRTRVLPLLPADARAEGSRLLDDIATPTRTCLVHGDLGPAHLLTTGGRVSGIIDWGDLRLGDPGLDLAWTLHGTPPEFAEALAASYGVTSDLRARALLWHRLGPWWEVLAGLDHLGPTYVDSGLAGVLDRLG
ncbi:MAG: phosphotransferase [Nocardioidaceae bacterium]